MYHNVSAKSGQKFQFHLKFFLKFFENNLEFFRFLEFSTVSKETGLYGNYCRNL